MRRERVGVDIDDVIVPAAPHILDTYNAFYGTTLQLHEYYTRDLEKFGVDELSVAIQRVNDIVASDEFLSMPPLEEAVEALGEIAEKRDEFGITGRPTIIEAATNRWLLEHFTDYPFQEVVFTNYFPVDGAIMRSKADVCKELGIDYMIEDHLDHALSIAAAGIKVILFGSYPWNQHDDLPDNVTRVEGWPEVVDYFNAIDG